MANQFCLGQLYSYYHQQQSHRSYDDVLPLNHISNLLLNRFSNQSLKSNATQSSYVAITSTYIAITAKSNPKQAVYLAIARDDHTQIYLIMSIKQRSSIFSFSYSAIIPKSNVIQAMMVFCLCDKFEIDWSNGFQVRFQESRTY